MRATQEEPVYITCKRVGPYEYICYPACHASDLMCKLVGQDYLTNEQIKILELLGFHFEILEKTNTDMEEHHE